MADVISHGLHKCYHVVADVSFVMGLNFHCWQYSAGAMGCCHYHQQVQPSNDLCSSFGCHWGGMGTTVAVQMVIDVFEWKA